MIDNTLILDEAWFHLHSYVNTQDGWLWSSENLHAYHETLMHLVKSGMWCMVSQCRSYQLNSFWRNCQCRTLSQHPNAAHCLPGEWWERYVVSTRWGHLPHCISKHSISARIFQRPVDFAGTVVPKLHWLLFARFIFMCSSQSMRIQQ